MKLNYFFIFFFGVILLSGTLSGQSFADVIPPKHQMELDFTPEEVVCKENLVKVIRTDDESAACIQLDSVDTLVERDIVLAPEPDAILEAESKKSQPVGTITHVATTKHYKNPGEIETFPKINPYNYVFKICAIDERIKSPEVILTSDSETKSVKLREVVFDSCYTTAVKIRASDPNSISSRLLNQGGITEAITDLENQIQNLKSDISNQRIKLSSINDESPSTDRAKKVSAIHQKITDIRNELKNTRAELQKYLLFLSMSSTTDLSPISKGKSITGVAIDGVVSEIISVNLALIQPENIQENASAYNTVFEICAGDTTLRLPIVELSSDIGNTTVKMAEKIIANSCQMSTGKITAVNPSTISIKLAGQTSSSSDVITFEKKIDEIKDAMKVEQDHLNSISTSSTISKQEREIAITESTIKIEQLRKELNDTKVKLHKILLEVYR